MLKFYKPLIIAEIGLSHNGNLKEALKLIQLSKNSGADVVKFQDEIPIQYPSFIANDIDGVRLTKNLGNSRGVLPFTVIVQPDGLVKKSFYGKVNISELNQALSDNSF